MEFWRLSLALVVVVSLAVIVFVAGGLDQSSKLINDNFVEKNVEYDAVEALTDVDGKLAYIGLTHSEGGFLNESFVVFDGRQLAEEYLVKPGVSDMNTPLAVDGKLAYWASEGDEFVVLDGKEGERHNQIIKITDINGKLAYRALNRESQESESESSDDSDIIQAPDFDVDVFTVYDGRRLAEQVEHTPVSFPREMGGELTFVAAEGNQRFIIHGGDEVGRAYENATAPRDVNGTLAYKVVEDGKEFLVYNGQKMSQRYDQIEMGSVTAINGTPAFKAVDHEEEFIVYRGERLGKNYDDVSDPVNAGGNLAYSLGNNSDEDTLVKSFTLFYGGEQLGEQYDNVVWSGAVVDGKPAYMAQDMEEREAFVVVGDRERERYDAVDLEPIKEINGKLVYVAYEDREAFVVYGGRKIRNDYDEILGGPIEVGGKLVFAAERDGSVYIVREQ